MEALRTEAVYSTCLAVGKTETTAKGSQGCREMMEPTLPRGRACPSIPGRTGSAGGRHFSPGRQPSGKDWGKRNTVVQLRWLGNRTLCKV